MPPAAVLENPQADVSAAPGSNPLPIGSKAPESPLLRSHEEHQYLDLLRDILDHGEHRPDRTGTGTYSIFAPPQLRFALSRSTHGNEDFKLVLPLLTTKRVFLRAVVAELLWFVSGNTSSTTLSDQNVHIWDGNGSREFLDKAGLSHRAEGDLGPVYGFQWRHFGAEYEDATSNYKGRGVDQLAEVVRKLKSSPFDRRIILSAWNPADLGKMALPPCHMFAQFYVSFPSKKRRTNATSKLPESEGPNAAPEKGVLHTILYQRSCDMGLGIPFNIASYALLTHMLAHACDLMPGSLTHTMGDAHVYLDHIDALKVQLEREPRDFPTMEVPEEKRGRGLEALESWTAEDFIVKDYNPHKAVPMKMSV
ncbi:MAG: Thymidylate synthase [Alyxoria varia]|nr:MAG: Thymidylate synthase [Alyxoria varia]